MFNILLRRILPLLVLGALTLSSCVVHERDRGPRGPRGPRGHRSGPGYGYGRGPGRGY